MKNLDRLSKFLALILRHEPLNFGLELDEEGFTDAQDVWGVVEARYGNRYIWADIETVVAGDKDGKKRYELRDWRIRAMYGHNRSVSVTYPPAVPLALLYHGTNEKALASIRETGLLSLGRQYVHLTTNLERAVRVAQRRSEKIVMLTIRALEAHQEGVVFYHAETEHYLVKSVAPDYITFP